MEKRKNNCSSYNRVNDAMLLEILRENEISCKSNLDKDPERNSCGCGGEPKLRRYNTVADHRRSCIDNITDEGRSCRLNTIRNSASRCTGPISSSRPCNYNDQNYNARLDDSGMNTGCGCNEKCISDSCVNSYPPAMVYCPDHEFNDIYECEEALEHGTLFRVLDLVFYPSRYGNCK